MTIGFDKEQTHTPDLYSDYIGKPGHYSVGPISATGILVEINTQERYLKVQPSIVSYGENMRLEDKLPTTITLEPGNPIAVRPLREGDLKDIVEKKTKKASNKIILAN